MLVREQDWVVDRVVEVTRRPTEEVRQFLDLVRHVVDSLIADDQAVLVPPFFVADEDDPVFRRLLFCLKDPRFELSYLGDSTPEELSESLRLPLDLVERYPLAGEGMVLVGAVDTLGWEDDRLDEAQQVLRAWADTFVKKDGSRRRYRVTPPGSEKTFEDWLESDLGVLDDFGYHVRVADRKRDGLDGRQHRLSPKLRPDLICRATRDSEVHRAGDWVVIENKTTFAHTPVDEQLSKYVDWLGAEVDEAVHGLLLADGTSVRLRRALRERGHDWITLASLGYRDHVRRIGSSPWEGEDRDLSYPSTLDPALIDDGAT